MGSQSGLSRPPRGLDPWERSRSATRLPTLRGVSPQSANTPVATRSKRTVTAKLPAGSIPTPSSSKAAPDAKLDASRLPTSTSKSRSGRSLFRGAFTAQPAVPTTSQPPSNAEKTQESTYSSRPLNADPATLRRYDSVTRPLRRKPAIIGEPDSGSRNDTPTSLQFPGGRADISQKAFAAQAILEVGPRTREPRDSPMADDTEAVSEAAKEPDGDAYQYSQHNLRQPPTPFSEISTTPSLRDTASPGAFSHVTTSTALSTYSPVVNMSPQIGPSAWNSPVKNKPGHAVQAAPNRQPTSPQKSQDVKPKSAQTSLPKIATSQPSTAAKSQVTSPSSTSSSRRGPSIDGKPEIVRPAELAYLNVDIQPTAASSQNAPVRPSRKGTTDLTNYRQEPRLVATDIPRLEQIQINANRPRPQTPSSEANSKISLDSDSRSINAAKLPKSSLPTAAPASSTRSKSKGPEPGPQTSQESLSTTSPKSFIQRFGFPGRSPKPANSPVTAPSPARLQKRPPMAGTGHEGYGKFRGRSGSSNSATTSRSSSTNETKRSSVRRSIGSPKATSPQDEFIEQRLSPVYMRGQGLAPNPLIGIADGGITPSSRSSLDEERPTPSVTSSQQTYGTPQTSLDPSPIVGQGPIFVGSQSTSPRTGLRSGPQHQYCHPDISKPYELILSSEHSLESGHERNVSSPSKEKSKKSTWLSKLNPFQRAHTAPLPDDYHYDEVGESDMILQPQSGAVAHYEIFGSGDPITVEELGKYLDAADGTDDDDDSITPYDALERARQQEALLLGHRAHNSIDFVAETLSPKVSNETPPSESNEATFTTAQEDIPRAEEAPVLREPRPRLQRIGRIPKAVPKTDRQNDPAEGMTRPFMMTGHRPFPHFDPAPFEIPSEAELDSEADLDKPNARNLREFLRIPKRHNSDQSGSSSSGTAPILYLATKVPPSEPPAEDQVWKEYDDFIDEVLTPQSEAASVQGGSKDYFQARPRPERSLTEPVERTIMVHPKVGELASTLRGELSPGLSPAHRSFLFSESMRLSDARSSGSVSFRDILDRRSRGSSHRLSAPHVDRGSNSSTKSSLKSGGRSSLPLPENPRSPIQPLKVRFEDEYASMDPRAMVNLRLGALMISKWLSFGQVLFSPAHGALSASGDERILVVDGLGKDWSYYVAMTYENVNIYNLGPSPANPGKRHSLGAFQPLSNHRHFQHPSLAQNFPFPKNFFAAVIFRFPIATTEEVLAVALAECKRVLRPGGYLEVSALDLDLANAGSRGRWAQRRLKEKIHAADPDISLKPASDNIQYHLGKRGFENLNRCIVGVPAAGSVADSREHSVNEKEASFTDLVGETSKESDEGITKMVAKVGRWWYTRCYESIIMTDADSSSMWNDKFLLKECEQMGTHFKLLVCYAQKPNPANRRTQSL